MSTVVGGIITDLKTELPDVPPHFIASALSIIAGSIVLFIGLIRCGWVVELIPLVALSSFMTGSAINIAVGQLPGLMGITGFSTRDAPYLVFINFLKGLPRTTLDAAIGLTALTMLYLIRGGCNYAARRNPNHQKLFFFLSTLRTAFVILFYVMISAAVNLHRRNKPAFKILLDVPRGTTTTPPPPPGSTSWRPARHSTDKNAGFQNAEVPLVNTRILSALTPYYAVTVIVLLIEHIAISKSFGRVNNYTINPSQEMVAIGVTNVLGPFLGAYPATGSFSRTAIKSKAGVRTPFAGVITALVVLLAIYALPPLFYYIPNAALSAVIIHAVGDLITPPNTVYRFWRVNPFEVLIFFVGVLVTVFSTIENGIYCTISISAGMLLFRILKGKGRFLGRVKVHSVLGDHVIGEDHIKTIGEYGTFRGLGGEVAARNIFLPIDHGDGSNPQVELESPLPRHLHLPLFRGLQLPQCNAHARIPDVVHLR